MIGLSPWEQAQIAAEVRQLIEEGGKVCTITRESGHGAHTRSETQTAVPYWRDDPTRARLAAMAGGALSAIPETLYLLPDADVQPKDVVADGALRWVVDGIGEMTEGVVQTVYATRRVGP